MLISSNYVHISGWMYSMGLSKLNEVVAFAIIYGFSQDGESTCNKAYSYIADFLMCDKRTAIRVIKSLEDKGLIRKERYTVNNVNFNRYSVPVEVVTKYHHLCSNVTNGSDKMSPHINNNTNTITNNNSSNSPTISRTMNSTPNNSPITTLPQTPTGGCDQPTIFKDDIPQEKVLDEKEIIQLIMSFWNTETKFTKIRSIEGTRRKMLIARLKEEGADNVMKAIQIANQSSFLTEKWKMNFDWFVKPSNFNKVVEGNYNNDNAYGNPASRPTDAQILRAAIDQSWGPGGDPLADIL